MKTKSGIIIIMLLTGLIIGAAQPAMLYAGGGTSGGTLWDPFTDPSFIGTKKLALTGTLSIVYNPNFLATPCVANGQSVATMFYSVRLIDKSSNIYTFEGATEGVCLGDITAQGQAVMNFLDYAVHGIYPSVKTWKVNSVKNPGISMDSLSFVADITIGVK